MTNYESITVFLLLTKLIPQVGGHGRKAPWGRVAWGPKSVASGGGNAGTSAPPEIGEIVGEIRCYLREVYTFGAEPELQEIFRKNCEKSQFFIQILIKKSESFLETFQNSLHFWSKRAKFCRHLAQFYLPNRNHSLDLDYLAFFYKIQSIFS